MLKSAMHVWKLCWKHVEKAYWKFQHMLKISMCVENHVKNVYVNHVENQVKNCVEVQKKQRNQFNFLVKIYTIFWYGTYIKLWEVRNYVWKQSRVFKK